MTTLLTVGGLLLGSTALAQSEGKVAVGASVSAKAGTSRDISGHINPGLIWRIGHGGGAPGMNGVLWIYPESGLVIVVLANMDPPAAQDVGRFIEAQLLMK